MSIVDLGRLEAPKYLAEATNGGHLRAPYHKERLAEVQREPWLLFGFLILGCLQAGLTYDETARQVLSHALASRLRAVAP